MPTVGFTGPFSTWEWTGINFENQIASELLTIPENGTIDTLAVYVGSRGGTFGIRVCLWNAAGQLLRETGTVLSTGSDSVNGQGWVTVGITPLVAGAGSQFRVGWNRDPAYQAVWSLGSGGGHQHQTDIDGYHGTPATVGGSFHGGRIGATFGYGVSGGGGGGGGASTSGVKRWNGASWVKHPVKRWNGSAWVRHPVKRWTGSAWVE